MYLDTQEVNNLLEAIEGGLVEQIKETAKETKTKAGEAAAGIPQLGLGAKGNLQSVREEASEAVRQQGPVSRLIALREILIENDYVSYFNCTAETQRDTLREGTLIEVTGSLQLSAFGQVVYMASNLLELNTVFGGAFGDIDAGTLQGMAYLRQVTSKGVVAYIEPEKCHGARRKFDFACIFKPDSLRVDADQLDGRVTVLGRIRKIPARNEPVFLYDLIPGMGHLPRADAKELVKQLSSSREFRITERDLRLCSPDVLIAPIAMYS
jgi:hypothetical protein